MTATKKATKPPVVHEGKLLRAIPTPQLKLATLEDCRREMARVYRDARTGATDTADASRLVYMLNTIAKMIETAALADRLTPLEQADSPLSMRAYNFRNLSDEELETMEALLIKANG